VLTLRLDEQVLYHDSPVDASLLLLYVHQNYTQFCNEIEEISCISERLSIADSILGGSEMVCQPSAIYQVDR
jgi:cell cycle checkpoint protein